MTDPAATIREALTDAHPGPLPEHDPMCRTNSGYPDARAKGCDCSVSRNAAALAALTELEADRDRYREALVRISGGPLTRAEMREIARAALDRHTQEQPHDA